MLARHGEGLAEPSWTGAKETRVGDPTPDPHLLEPLGRLQCAQEHGICNAFLSTNDVQAPVDTVGAVDVRPTPPGRNIDALRSVRRLPIAVRGRILVIVGLDLDDHPADAVDVELGADQLGRDLVWATRRGSRAS